MELIGVLGGNIDRYWEGSFCVCVCVFSGNELKQNTLQYSVKQIKFPMK